MSILLSNRILEAAEEKIEGQLTPENRANYMRIVVSGLKIALAKGPNSIMATLEHSRDPVEDSAKGALALLIIMRKESRGTMPVKAMVPAGMTLMLHALDFADKAGIARIGTGELVHATHIFTNLLFKWFKITPQMLHHAAAKVHAITQDPAQMELLNRKAGFSKDPRAGEPTPLPEAKDAV